MLRASPASKRARLPLSRFPCLDVPSLEEAAEIYSRMTAPVRIRGVPSNEPFFWRLHHLALGPLAFFASETSPVQADCEGASDAYLISIPLSTACAETTFGSSTKSVVHGKSALVCMPWQDSRVLVRSGFKVLQITIPQAAVTSAVTTLTGSTSRAVHFKHRLALDAPQATPFARLVAHVLKEADHERPDFSRPGTDKLIAEALIFRFLLSQEHSQSSLLSSQVQGAEPRHVRRAAEYMDAHFTRPITMAELTRATQVSARSLQAGFLKHRGCSPLAFLRARRLERARLLLLTSDAVNTVSEAAQLTGIDHLGRFSVRYRQRFGESPTDTLGRRWSRAG